jgi:hypothetical protein
VSGSEFLRVHAPASQPGSQVVGVQVAAIGKVIHLNTHVGASSHRSQGHVSGGVHGLPLPQRVNLPAILEHHFIEVAPPMLARIAQMSCVQRGRSG